MNVYNPYYVLESHDIQHHGVLGQKWGVRRYQNKDGSLTSAGIKRYGIDTKRDKKANKIEKKLNKKIEKSEKYDEKMYETRRHIRDNMEKRFNKKIEKNELKGKTEAVKNLKIKKNIVLKDYDLGTKSVEKAFNKYNQILKDYRDAQIDFLYNGPNEAYYRAVKDCINQNTADHINSGGSLFPGTGSKITKAQYASKYAAEAIEKLNRKKK